MNREEKKAQTRRRIADSALELFELQGFEATTVQQIAERAEVAKGTFFNYYNSKEDLILELQGMLILKEMETVFGKPGPIMPRLQVVLLEYCRNYPINRSGTRAVIQGMYASQKLRDAQNEYYCGLHDSLGPILARAQSRGEIRSDIPAETIAQLAVQTYIGALTSWAMEQGEPELSDQMAITFEVFIQGISP